MDEGVALMEAGQYQEADIKFKEVLEKLNPVPSNLVFYIGKNSYFLKNYKQSIDWLNKYMALKGTGGMYFKESSELLRKSEQLLLDQKASDTTAFIGTDTLFTHNYVDCGNSGKFICPVCKGQTVIIEKGKFGTTYRTCPFSDDKGMLTCDEYNLLIQGKLKPKAQR